MIILMESVGNHSNRLFQTVHIEAFCLEYGIRFVNMCFGDMRHLYAGTPMDLSFLRKGVKALNRLRLLDYVSFDDFNNVAAYERLMLKASVLLVGGWGFRVYELTKKYHAFFKQRYELSSCHYERSAFVSDVMALKNSGTILVGVHVRKGDYREWEDGKYFFDDDVYRKYMVMMDDSLRSAGVERLKFVVFGNESHGIEGNANVLPSNNPWYIDQYLMSRCDYVIGPPSTFSLWASYIGETKVFHIKDKHGQLELRDFSVCHG